MKIPGKEEMLDLDSALERVLKGGSELWLELEFVE